MSFLKALAGAAVGVGNLANKYIDEELAQQRAQALADIQRNSAIALDQYNNSDERQAKLRANATAATLASKEAERMATIAGADDEAYQRALDRTSEAQTQRNIKSKVAELDGTADAEARATGMKQRAISDNQVRELSPGQKAIRGDGSLVGENTRATPQEVHQRLNPVESGLKLPEAVKIQAQEIGNDLRELGKTINKGIADGTLATELDPDGKNKPQYNAYQHLLTQQRVLSAQRERLLRPYMSDSGEREDPAGIRGGGEGSTREAQMKAILEDMRKSGVSEADVQLGDGPRQRIGADGKQVPAAPAKTAPDESFFSRAWRSAKEALAPVGAAMAPNLDAHAKPLLSRDSWSAADINEARQLLAMDSDNPAKPLTPQLRAELERRLKGSKVADAR